MNGPPPRDPGPYIGIVVVVMPRAVLTTVNDKSNYNQHDIASLSYLRGEGGDKKGE